jgi:hypothetical protein
MSRKDNPATERCGPVSYDLATHLFSVPVSAGHNGSTMITLSAR